MKETLLSTPWARLSPLALACLTSFSSSALADDLPASENALSTVQVSGQRTAQSQYQLPQTTERISKEHIAETINAVDTEDAVKYLPSIFIRKRSFGDTQPVMATRTWGVNSSARSLVYADGTLLTALVANNNTIGAPRWGLVAPAEIESIEMLYGPYAAAYPGNAMGAVMNIATRMPNQLEGGMDVRGAYQHFKQYGTDDKLKMWQGSAYLGGHAGAWSWWLSANAQDSYSQPLSYVTTATGTSAPVSGTNGTVLAQNKLGQAANVIGAGGMLHTQMENAKVKIGYDFTPEIRATYNFGYWQNDGRSQVQSYLTSAANGATTYGGQSSFASNDYTVQANHSAHSFSVKSDTRGLWDFEANASMYRFDKDWQLNPANVTGGNSGAGFSGNGKLAQYDGTGWNTLDVKGIFRPTGKGGAHNLSFGAHQDTYTLVNPTYNVANWNDGSGQAGLSTFGGGKTQTLALWAQDAWRFAPNWRATVGGRFEDWTAYQGVNVSGNSSGTTTVQQPKQHSQNVSPKLSLSWEVLPESLVTASFGQAYRYPTVAELYQLVSTGATFTAPNPNLKPENVQSGELAFEKHLQDGKVRLSLFQENVRDALISQTATLNTTTVPTTYVMNVDKVRNRGVELAFQQNDVLRGFDVSGSVTYVNSRIMADQSFVSTTGTSAVGKKAPYVPNWRATLVMTYRPTEQWALSLAGRYSGKQYSTMDNSETTGKVMGAFDSYLVLDAKVQYKIDKQWTAAFGVDNLTNRQYFLFHPFPQRTFVGSLKYRF